MSESGPLVVIAVDGSQQAEYALNWYLEHIHQENHHLLLIHTVEPLIVAAGSMPAAVVVPDRAMETAKNSAKKLEQKLSNLMQERKVQGKFIALMHPRAGEVIVETAAKEKAKMIVVGTRGLGTLRRTILGSVSDYVLHHCHCPVVICRQPGM